MKDAELLRSAIQSAEAASDGFRVLSEQESNDRKGAVGAIAGVLVAMFGASPAIAAVLKIFVAPAAVDICKAWGKTLTIDSA